MTNKKITPAQNKLISEALCQLAATVHKDNIDRIRSILVESILKANKQTADHQSEEATSDAIMKSAGFSKPTVWDLSLQLKDVAARLSALEASNSNRDMAAKLFKLSERQVISGKCHAPPGSWISKRLTWLKTWLGH